VDKGGDSMKKLLGCFLSIILVLCFAGTAMAYPVDIPIGTVTGLPNSSPDAEFNWANGLLNPQLTSPLDYVKFDPVATGAVLPPDGFDPGFDWYLAVIKQGDTWYAFSDIIGNPLPNDPGRGDNHLVFDQRVQSHISFWGVQSVPEPATMLLLGSGILGLVLVGRQRFK